LSDNGNEVCFCTIGDASTSEGHFWEGVNAAGVLQIPLAVFIWDDGYGISVPKELQTTKGSISTAIRGMEKMEGTNGVDIYNLKGWDYAGMCEVLDTAIQKIRDTHTPAIFHIEEITQPQGHSTSGSHERYKSPERLQWEREWDCIAQMRKWILENALAVSKAGDTVLLSATTESKKLTITIADQGPGIASTMIDSLFEPFSTTSANGTGLGLSIAKNTFDAHRGTIGVHNTPEGAVFKITLPITQS
jgi:TPP-dependent pyruvate/acetoin dehydrogenase alpha subunit